MTTGNAAHVRLMGRHTTAAHPFYKRKDLMQLPARLGIALQQAGWWLRNDGPWVKPNVLPETVKDRFTRNHETVLHLTVGPKNYWESREPAAWAFYGKQVPGKPVREGPARASGGWIRPGRRTSGRVWRGTPRTGGDR
jgi:site-specific DNA-methyltransferase (adenine-specific)